MKNTQPIGVQTPKKWKTYLMVGSVALVSVVGVAYAISPSKVTIIEKEQELLHGKNIVLEQEIDLKNREMDLNSIKWSALESEKLFIWEKESE